jgi:NADH-quinone oxidoreductase subunit G
VPFENDAVNECWISDRDRFAYEGLATGRLLRPQLKQDGRWHEVDWPVALDYAAHALRDVRERSGAAAIGALASPQSTLEELALLARLTRGLGSENVDHRLRQRDFSLDAATSGAPWLGMPVAEVNALDALLIVGSFLRKDHPLLAARVRAAARRGARVGVVHAVAEDLLMPVAARATVAPGVWARTLAGVLLAALRAAQREVPVELAGIEASADEAALAAALASGERRAIWLGNAAAQADDFGVIARLARALAEATGASLGVVGEAANSVGGWLAGAVPGSGGLDARQMVEQPLAAYLLLGLEPSLDHGLPARATAALAQARTVVALTAFDSPDLREAADCLLPIAPFSETAGTFVNAEGRAQSFNGVVRPMGESRPAWKVLRVLANLLELSGFDAESSEQIRDEVLATPVETRLSNAFGANAGLPAPAAVAGLQRVAHVMPYGADPVVRRAESLQRTRAAQAPVVAMHPDTLASLGVSSGEMVVVEQPGGSACLPAQADAGVAPGAVWLAAAHPATAGLAAIAGPVSVRKA